MLAAVNFDNQARLMACKIDDVFAESNLPAKMRIGRRREAAQMLPELALRISRVLAHAARKFAGMGMNGVAIRSS
jgi:hypothetical protein